MISEIHVTLYDFINKCNSLWFQKTMLGAGVNVTLYDFRNTCNSLWFQRYMAAYNTMHGAGVNVTLYEYDAKHSFMDFENKDAYCESCATLARTRLFEFMNTNLE